MFDGQTTSSASLRIARSMRLGMVIVIAIAIVIAIVIVVAPYRAVDEIGDRQGGGHGYR